MRGAVAVVFWALYGTAFGSAQTLDSTTVPLRHEERVVTPSGRVVVMGSKGSGIIVVRVVEPSSGRILQELEGHRLRWYRAANYAIVDVGAEVFAFDIAAGRAVGPLQPTEVLLRELRDGPARDRLTALRTLIRMPTTEWPSELSPDPTEIRSDRD